MTTNSTPKDGILSVTIWFDLKELISQCKTFIIIFQIKGYNYNTSRIV